MVFGKSIELVFECIPSTIIQAMAFVNDVPSTIAVFSIASSILTAAFVSASITIEKDIDKFARKHYPSNRI